MTKKAIITGGSTGIGRATAVVLAKSGHDVAITYANSSQEANKTKQLVEAEGKRCVVNRLDLTDPENGPPCVDELVGELGGLDVCVSNAGLMTQKRVPNIDLETIQRIFNVNTFGAMLVIQRAVHHLLPSGMNGSPREIAGRVIIVTSVHEVIANPDDTLYTMSKHALGGLVKCLALDLSPLNITVNAVAPGEIATPMNDMKPSNFGETYRPAIPVRRTGHPDEIASVIRYLASDEAGFVTGARWPVDGGFETATPLAASAYRENYLER